LEWSDPAQGELAGLLPGTADPHTALGDALIGALARRLGPVKRDPLPAPVYDQAVALVVEHRFQ
jgi:hypothetical protein